jgi:hypothetical protein
MLKVGEKEKLDAIEFLPDEPEVEETPATNEIAQPESPLDDLRQMINQETQQ